jgi:general stress protein 26
MEKQIDRVWDIVEKVGVCMLTTQSSDRLRARPVEARLKRDTGVIFVVTDIRSMKAEEIEAAPDVGLTFIDTAQNAYLSMTGRAGLARDVAKIREVWRKTDEMWWPGGPADSNVCLLRIEPVLAELWDGPASAAVRAFEIVKATVTGKEPNLGENRKVTAQLGRLVE